MCVEQGIYRAPHARLAQITDALWRAWRIVIDCGLHSGKLDHKKASRLLMEGVGFTARRAEGDVNWYTSAPTVPMSYLIGRLELEKLHAKLVVGSGWPLKQFNDWILSFGAIPWSWIWQSALTAQNLPIATQTQATVRRPYTTLNSAVEVDVISSTMAISSAR